MAQCSKLYLTHHHLHSCFLPSSSTEENKKQMDLPFTVHSLRLKRLMCCHISLPSYLSSTKHRQLLFKDNASVCILHIIILSPRILFLVASPIGSISSNTQNGIFSDILWALSMFRYHGKHRKLL